MAEAAPDVTSHSTGLDHVTIAEAAALIAGGALSPVELVQAKLRRVAAQDAVLHGFVTPTPELALAQAGEAAAEIAAQGPRGPLHGIPYALKDVIETAGIRTTAQSRLLAAHVPQADAVVQTRMRAAGGVLMGKNTTWEFAHGGPSWDIVAPPARNPWNAAHHPSGSSSGSAVAIASGMILGAIATDTGGSIRGPAAACGVVGLKPTYGLVSRRGVLPNSFSQDNIGPMAATVEDAAILLDAIAGYDPLDPGSAEFPPVDYRAALAGGVRGLRIGVPWDWLETDLPPSPATRAAFEAALEVFTQLGASIRPVALPPIRLFEDVKKTIAMSELFTIHAADLRARPELFGDSLRYRIIAGGLIRAEEYLRAAQARTVLARATQRAFAGLDVIMLPTAEPAGKLEPTPPASLFTHISYTTAWNIGGNPALALPCGFADNGMPFSLQIVGRLFDEACLLRAGHAYQGATRWQERHPPAASQDPS